MGIVYLVQSALIAGTNRYKIGCTRKSSVTGFHSCTRYLEYIIWTNNDSLFLAKELIVREFRKKFRVFIGRNYFIGDEENFEKIKKYHCDKEEVKLFSGNFSYLDFNEKQQEVLQKAIMRIDGSTLREKALEIAPQLENPDQFENAKEVIRDLFVIDRHKGFFKGDNYMKVYNFMLELAEEKELARERNNMQRLKELQGMWADMIKLSYKAIGTSLVL